MTTTDTAPYDHLTAGEVAAQLLARADSSDRRYAVAGGSTVAPGTASLRAAAAKLLEAATLEYRVVDDAGKQEYPPKGQPADRGDCIWYISELAGDRYPIGHLRIQERRPATDWTEARA